MLPNVLMNMGFAAGANTPSGPPPIYVHPPGFHMLRFGTGPVSALVLFALRLLH